MKKRIILIAGLLTIVAMVTFVILFWVNHSVPQLEGFETDSIIGEVIESVSSVDIVEHSRDEVVVSIQSPNIAEDLIRWYEELDEEIDEFQVETKVQELLRSKEVKDNTIKMDVEGGHIIYTAEYADAVSCGISSFYQYVINDFLNDISETVNSEGDEE